MKRPYGEIIRGDVSSRYVPGAAGGMSYFSSGSVKGSWLVPERVVCAEAVARSTANPRAKHRLAVKTLEYLMWSEEDWAIGLWSSESSKRSTTLQSSNHLAGVFLNSERPCCRDLSALGR